MKKDGFPFLLNCIFERNGPILDAQAARQRQGYAWFIQILVVKLYRESTEISIEVLGVQCAD